jgi:beta-lactamase class A
MQRRRQVLLALASLSMTPAVFAGTGHDGVAAQAEFEKLERDLGGRLGVYALDTASGAQLGYRAGERFPVCSTFKVLAAAALLKQAMQTPDLLQRRITYSKSELVTYSPVTEKHVDDGMTVAELCAAAIQYSDNTAGNQLLKLLDGPSGLTAFLRSIGDADFRLDRWETALNTAIPVDVRDTSTPAAMGQSLQRLALGSVLNAESKQQLKDWMLGNTTGKARIQAALPPDWQIGDKTGSGDYGSGNDLAIVWPPKRPPLIIAVYTTQYKQKAPYRNDIIASAAGVAVRWSNVD